MFSKTAAGTTATETAATETAAEASATAKATAANDNTPVPVTVTVVIGMLFTHKSMPTILAAIGILAHQITVTTVYDT